MICLVGTLTNSGSGVNPKTVTISQLCKALLTGSPSCMTGSDPKPMEPELALQVVFVKDSEAPRFKKIDIKQVNRV